MKSEERKNTIKTTIIEQADKVLGLTICVQIFKYLEQNMMFCNNQRAWLTNTRITQCKHMDMKHVTRHDHEFEI